MASIGAHDVMVRLPELLDRAAKGESFEIVKDGRPIARLVPAGESDRAEVVAAAERLKSRLARAPRVSEAESQANWDRLKSELEAEDDERMDRWLSSSTPR